MARDKNKALENSSKITARGHPKTRPQESLKSQKLRPIFEPRLSRLTRLNTLQENQILGQNDYFLRL